MISVHTVPIIRMLYFVMFNRCISNVSVFGISQNVNITCISDIMTLLVRRILPACSSIAGCRLSLDIDIVSSAGNALNDIKS